MDAKRSDLTSGDEPPHTCSTCMTLLLTRSQWRFLKLTSILSVIFGICYIIPFVHSTEPIPYPHIFTTHSHTLPQSTIGKVTASFVLREQMLSGLWSKHAYILTLLGTELSKPSNERLQWLFWSDRDTILMNPNIPLEVFLPPDPAFAHINLLVTRDRNGLNNGVFFLRIHQWSFKFFASALSIREYLPEVELKYTEQSAMEEVIKRSWWNSSVAYVPQRWFNGFPPSSKPSASSASAHPGSLLIHFASNRDGLRPERMARWGKVARKKDKEWYRPYNGTGYPAEIKEYWERVGNGEDMERICDDIGKKEWT